MPLAQPTQTTTSRTGNLHRDVSKIARCCDRHDEAETLVAHLIRDFPDLETRLVLREFERAWTAVQWLLHADEGLVTTELIVRNQLLLMTGERADHAHLDPQHHPSRTPREEATNDNDASSDRSAL